MQSDAAPSGQSSEKPSTYGLGRRGHVGPAILFVMLNPSTANAYIEVVNLFAYGATHPRNLKAAG